MVVPTVPAICPAASPVLSVLFLQSFGKQSLQFEWKIFRGITVLGLLEKIQKRLTDPQCEPEHFTGRIIFMSMFNDFEWDAKGYKE